MRGNGPGSDSLRCSCVIQSSPIPRNHPRPMPVHGLVRHRQGVIIELFLHSNPLVFTMNGHGNPGGGPGQTVYKFSLPGGSRETVGALADITKLKLFLRSLSGLNTGDEGIGVYFRKKGRKRERGVLVLRAGRRSINIRIRYLRPTFHSHVSRFGNHPSSPRLPFWE